MGLDKMKVGDGSQKVCDEKVPFKGKFCKSVVWPAMVYGSECCGLQIRGMK